MISYKDALINAWTKTNLIHINDLRKVYSEIYFQNHKHRTSIPKEEYRISRLINNLSKDCWQYENRDDYYKILNYKKELIDAHKETNDELKLKALANIGKSNDYDGSIYRIIKKFGHRVPMSNGIWKYDPASAEFDCDTNELYFKNLTNMVVVATQQWFENLNIDKDLLKLEIKYPGRYFYGMTIDCYLRNNFIEIPLRINLRQKSLGVYNPFKQEVAITFYDSFSDNRKNMFNDFQFSFEKIIEMFIK